MDPFQNEIFIEKEPYGLINPPFWFWWLFTPPPPPGPRPPRPPRPW